MVEALPIKAQVSLFLTLLFLWVISFSIPAVKSFQIPELGNDIIAYLSDPKTDIKKEVNYKNSIINYYSMPLYYSLEEYGYDVENLIEGSIRDITQKLYSRQFNLIRA